MQSQVEDETRRLVALVEETTGLRSRWNGTVRIIDAATAAGGHCSMKRCTRYLWD